MPFESEAQRRLFHTKADRGEISQATVKHWEHATKNKEELPYHKGKEAALAVYDVKTAVTLSQMRQARKRIPVHKPPADLSVLGPIQIPTRAQQEPTPRAQALFEFQKSFIPANVRKVIEPLMLREQQNNPGRIYMTPEAGALLSPRNPRAGEAFARLHEANERKQKIQTGTLHGSPTALMHDFNARSRLTGRGAATVQQELNVIRAPEDAVLRQQLTSTFKDPRAAQFMQPGSKIPKAMQRAFTQTDPEMSKAQLKGILREQRPVAMQRLRASAK